MCVCVYVSPWPTGRCSVVYGKAWPIWKPTDPTRHSVFTCDTQQDVDIWIDHAKLEPDNVPLFGKRGRGKGEV
jgi:hypothetical protein